jgi:hypothetical protein
MSRSSWLDCLFSLLDVDETTMSGVLRKQKEAESLGFTIQKKPRFVSWNITSSASFDRHDDDDDSCEKYATFGSCRMILESLILFTLVCGSSLSLGFSLSRIHETNVKDRVYIVWHMTVALLAPALHPIGKEDSFCLFQRIFLTDSTHYSWRQRQLQKVPVLSVWEKESPSLPKDLSFLYFITMYRLESQVEGSAQEDSVIDCVLERERLVPPNFTARCWAVLVPASPESSQFIPT